MNKNQFAPVPPMGWNSFDYYDNGVDEAAVKANAEYMAKYLKPLGWEYVIVDIQWYAYNVGSKRKQYEYIPFECVEIDSYGRLLPCPDRFPSAENGAGFKVLADYIHGLGLKFGIHIMRGIPRHAAERRLPVMGTQVTADQIADPYSICLWNPDMYGVRDVPEGQAYYDSIMELYASWGVDFIKCDDICKTRIVPDRIDAQVSEIKMLHRAIQKCGRPIVLSLSPGPALLERGTEYSMYANMWRMTDDFWDNWQQLRKMFDYCEKWVPFVKKGCYPDCDMLPLGRIGQGFLDERQTRFTFEEQKTMMTLWCMMHSPLMLGAELTMMDEQTLSLITNAEILDLNQSMENEVIQVKKENDQVVWASRNAQIKLYLALFNLEDTAAEICVTEEELADRGIVLEKEAEATDVWSGTKLEIKKRAVMAEVAEHGVLLVRIGKK